MYLMLSGFFFSRSLEILCFATCCNFVSEDLEETVVQFQSFQVPSSCPCLSPSLSSYLRPYNSRGAAWKFNAKSETRRPTLIGCQMLHGQKLDSFLVRTSP